jgi:hypothetical protein
LRPFPAVWTKATPFERNSRLSISADSLLPLSTPRKRAPCSLAFSARPRRCNPLNVFALVAIFLPGLLLVYGMLPFWDTLRSRQSAQAAMRGANAAVVGILGAALYHPVWTSAVLTPRDFALALMGFLLLTVWKAPPWIVVVLLAAAGALLGTVRNF